MWSELFSGSAAAQPRRLTLLDPKAGDDDMNLERRRAHNAASAVVEIGDDDDDDNVDNDE